MKINNKSSRLLQMLHKVEIKALYADKTVLHDANWTWKWAEWTQWRDLDMCWLLHHEERMLDWQQIFSSYVCRKLHSSLPTWLAFEGVASSFRIFGNFEIIKAYRLCSWDFDWLPWYDACTFWMCDDSRYWVNLRIKSIETT